MTQLIISEFDVGQLPETFDQLQRQNQLLRQLLNDQIAQTQETSQQITSSIKRVVEKHGIFIDGWNKRPLEQTVDMLFNTIKIIGKQPAKYGIAFDQTHDEVVT